MSGEHMKVFLFQHRRDAFGQRREGRMAQHRQLILAITVDELGVGEEVEPVVYRRVKRIQEPVTTERSPFQKFSRFEFSRIAEVVDEQVAHLPAVAHFFAVHPD
jgi:hypothetical protein